MSDPLGRANFEIGATNDNLKQVIAESKREVQSLDETQTGTAKKAEKLTDDLELYFETLRFNAAKAERQAGSLGARLDKIGRAASKLQAALSRLIIPVALVGGFVKLVDGIANARGELDKFKKSLDAVGDASRERLAAIQQQTAGITDSEQAIAQLQEQTRKEIEDISKTLEEQSLKIGQRFKDQSLIYQYVIGGATSGQLKEAALAEIEKINEATRVATAKLREQARREQEAAVKAEAESEAKARVDAIAKSLDQINELTRQTQIDLLPPAEQIAAKLEEAIAKAREGVETAGIIDDPDIQAAVERYEAWLREKARLDTLALEDRIKEERTAEIEKGQHVAKANADAFEREMERVLATLSSSFGFDLTGVDQIVSVGDKIAAAIDRNGGMR